LGDRFVERKEGGRKTCTCGFFLYIADQEQCERDVRPNKTFRETAMKIAFRENDTKPRARNCAKRKGLSLAHNNDKKRKWGPFLH